MPKLIRPDKSYTIHLNKKKHLAQSHFIIQWDLFAMIELQSLIFFFPIIIHNLNLHERSIISECRTSDKAFIQFSVLKQRKKIYQNNF